MATAADRCLNCRADLHGPFCASCGQRAVPPTPSRRAGEVSGPVGIRLGLWSTSNPDLTDEDRAELRKSVESAPVLLRPILRDVAEDPDSLRGRLFTMMPRVFFAMLPVFAAILALFDRGRRFPTHLVFAAHVHAFAFIALTLAEAVKFSRNDIVQAVVGLVVMVTVLVCGLRGLRSVYAGGWVTTVAKAAGIGFIHLLSSIPAFIIILTWAAIAS